MQHDLLNGIKTKPMMIDIASIETNLFVRRELNTDHAMYLAVLIDDAESTVVLPPILVIPEYEVVDGEIDINPQPKTYNVVYGRHRLWAEGQILEHKQIKCLVIVSGIKTEAELIALAYKENCGGSLPPTSADTEHTVEALLERKVPKSKIAEMLGLPGSLARKFINSIESRLEKARVRRAVNIIVQDSKTVAQAAETVGVNPDKVRQFIAGQKRKEKEDDKAQITRGVKAAWKEASNKNAGYLRSVFVKYDEGEVSKEFVFGLFRELDQLHKRAESILAQWKKRFEAKVNVQ